MAAAILGVGSVLIGFLVQVGAFSASGFAGVFEPNIVAILWNSGIGAATTLQAAGFLLAVFFFVTAYRRNTSATPTKLLPLLLVGLFILTYSYSLVGHSVSHGTLARFSVFLHVLAVSFWVGSLYPLLIHCGSDSTSDLSALMRVFSTYANFLVAILFLSGGFLLFTIMTMEGMVWSSQYGYNLIIKLLVVLILLMLAAGNKWYWVPKLESDTRYVRGLRTSISVELVLAIVILFSTAFLTAISAAM